MEFCLIWDDGATKIVFVLTDAGFEMLYADE